jgi:predicted transglutaminase-like cysteine proteinase
MVRASTGYALLLCFSAFGAAPSPAATLPAAADPLAPLATPAAFVSSGGPDAFGTSTLNAGVTTYDVPFRRVSEADRADPLVLALAARLRGLDPMRQLSAVKGLVAQRIRLASDPETLGVANLWQNAGEALRRGAGDDEDIAIVMMQVLKAAGWDPRNLFISIGRHRRLGAHAVLLVRTPAGFYMLDSAEAGVVKADRAGAARFTPVLSVGPRHSWIHGYRLSQGAGRGAPPASR